jgi:hypothetical protein
VHEYKLKNQDAFIRHIGPVAQDFARFGYGESDLAINLQDADGVALAAIQGLYDIVKEKQAQIELLRAEKDAEIAAQREQIADLTARLQRIEEMLPDPAGAEIGGAQ